MSNKTLLLINPWIHDFAAYDFWAKPLGLLYLAAILRKNGYHVSYCDCLGAHQPALATMPDITLPTRRKDGTGRFLKQLIDKPEALQTIPRHYSRYGIPPALFTAQIQRGPFPDAILITSAMTYWYPGVVETISLVKKVFPQAPVILGGIYATLCPHHARVHSGADIVVSGPGQQQQALQLLSLITDVPITYQPSLKEPDSIPYPAFDLIDPLPYVCIASSRGCPYRCRYCASHILSPYYCARQPLAVVDELQYWHECFGVHNIAFYDDALLFKPESHFVPILKEILRRGISCTFHTPNGLHVTGMTADIAHLMIEVGFKTIRLGLETASEDCMARIGEKTTRQDFVQAVRCLREAGYGEQDIGVYLLAGLPRQTADEVEQSIRFVKEAGARPYLAEYSPIPGTRLWEKALRASRYDLAYEPLFHNNSIVPCEWDGFTREDLHRLKRMLH